jgi:DNA-binding GntR family transcriptional regulator
MSEIRVPLAVPRRQSLKEVAADYIRDQIFSGQLHAETRIDQDKIAEALGVSRIPIREALITLESEGVVKTKARRGVFVASLETEDILDHFVMYGLLSGLAAQRVAEKRPEGIVEQLAQLSKQMRDTDDPAEHDSLNYEFHRVINRAGGSRRLLSVLRTLSNSMPSQFFASNSEWGFRDQTFDEHDQIVEFIRSGDGAGARAALTNHFEHTGQQAVRTLQSAGFWDES